MEQIIINQKVKSINTTNNPENKVLTKSSSLKPLLVKTKESTQKTCQTQDINDIVGLVDKEFKNRESEINKLVDNLKEKEQELAYCENETKKEAEMLSLMNSSITFRKHTFFQLKENFEQFRLNKYSKLKESKTDETEKINEIKELIAIYEKDIIKVQRLKSSQMSSVDEITQDMCDIELCVQAKAEKLRDMEAETNSQNEILQQLQSRINTNDHDNRTLESQIMECNNLLAAALDKRQALEHELRSVQSLTDSTLADIDKEESQSVALSAKHADDLKTLDDQINALSMEASSLNKQRQQLELEKEKITQEIDNFKSILAENKLKESSLLVSQESMQIVRTTLYNNILKGCHNLRIQQHQLDQRHSTLNALETETVVLDGKINSCTVQVADNLANFTRLLSVLPLRRSRLSQLKEEIKARITSLESESVRRTQELCATTQASVDESVAVTQAMQLQVDTISTQLQETQAIAADIRKEIHSLTSDIIPAREEVRRQLTQAKTDREALVRELDRLRGVHMTRKSELQVTKEKLSEATAKCAWLQNQLSSLEHTLQLLLMDASTTATTSTTATATDDLNHEEGQRPQHQQDENNQSTTGWQPSQELLTQLNERNEKELQKLHSAIASNQHGSAIKELKTHLQVLVQENLKLVANQSKLRQFQDEHALKIQDTEKSNQETRLHIDKVATTLKHLQTLNDRMEYELSEYVSKKKRVMSQSLLTQNKKAIIAPRALSHELSSSTAPANITTTTSASASASTRTHSHSHSHSQQSHSQTDVRAPLVLTSSVPSVPSVSKSRQSNSKRPDHNDDDDDNYNDDDEEEEECVEDLQVTVTHSRPPPKKKTQPQPQPHRQGHSQAARKHEEEPQQSKSRSQSVPSAVAPPAKKPKLLAPTQESTLVVSPAASPEHVNKPPTHTHARTHSTTHTLTLSPGANANAKIPSLWRGETTPSMSDCDDMSIFFESNIFQSNHEPPLTQPQVQPQVLANAHPMSDAQPKPRKTVSATVTHSSLQQPQQQQHPQIKNKHLSNARVHSQMEPITNKAQHQQPKLGTGTKTTTTTASTAAAVVINPSHPAGSRFPGLANQSKPPSFPQSQSQSHVQARAQAQNKPLSQNDSRMYSQSSHHESTHHKPPTKPSTAVRAGGIINNNTNSSNTAIAIDTSSGQIYGAKKAKSVPAVSSSSDWFDDEDSGLFQRK